MQKNPIATVTISATYPGTSLAMAGEPVYEAEIMTDQQLIDGKTYLIVDEYFIAHYWELWEEVKKLRMK